MLTMLSKAACFPVSSVHISILCRLISLRFEWTRATVCRLRPRTSHF